MFCRNHPDKEAQAYCRKCGDPICDLCIYDVEGSTYCGKDLPPASIVKTRAELRQIIDLTSRNTVFIGHGHSDQWMFLERFLQKSLSLEVIEFDSQSAAGFSIKDRLQQMLDAAHFAFIIMTGENERGADDKRYARDNVIHEVGLFQGKLGFSRAIILLEEGCQEFSNKSGLVHITFPRGNIMAVTEKIREVLKREGIGRNPN